MRLAYRLEDSRGLGIFSCASGLSITDGNLFNLPAPFSDREQLPYLDGWRFAFTNVPSLRRFAQRELRLHVHRAPDVREMFLNVYRVPAEFYYVGRSGVQLIFDPLAATRVHCFSLKKGIVCDVTTKSN